MKTRILVSAIILMLALQGCKKDGLNSGDDTKTPGPVTHIEQMVVPRNFNYNTTQELTLDVFLADGVGTAFSGIKVDVYDAVVDPTQKMPNLLFSGMTGNDGRLNLSFTAPTYLKSVVVYPRSLGIPNNVMVPISGNTVKFLYANGKLQSRFENPAPPSYVTGSMGGFNRKAGIADKYSEKLGTWNSSGVPNYLMAQGDIITQSFLNKITASLPESEDVISAHPDYLDNSNQTNLLLNEASEVFVTFVHEGADYKNGLFYYVYDKTNPPQTPGDIDSLYTIFPNCSFTGSGGGLSAGNKVKLGNFAANKVIGFAIAANGYSSSTNTVGAGINVWYSNKNLNDEDASWKQHNVLLHDDSTDRFLVGFEDLVRDNSQSDEDFNDVVFYAVSNPLTGIDDDDIPPIDVPGDCDADGVSDVYDAYPCDATKAYDNYLTPDYGTLAFEDLWPHTGDYDMNDLLLRWQFRTVLNAQNKVVELHCKSYVGAKGGSFPVGFGVEFPFNAAAVNQVTGTEITKARATLSTKGLEAGHTKAVMLFFDQAADQLSQPGGSFYNTVNNSPIAYPDTLNLKMTFTTPMNPADVGTYPFNPFIFTTTRGHEVHLPGKANTALANTNLFNTGKDNSNPSEGRYYKTSGNLPWALHLPVVFQYPSEKTSIINAYLKFAEWAQSGGSNYPNWYVNEPGHISSSNLFYR